MASGTICIADSCLLDNTIVLSQEMEDNFLGPVSAWGTILSVWEFL